jgi:hypothetical protein
MGIEILALKISGSDDGDEDPGDLRIRRRGQSCWS